MRSLVVFGATSEISQAMLSALDREGVYEQFFLHSPSGWNNQEMFLKSLRGDVRCYEGDLSDLSMCVDTIKQIATDCPAPYGIAFFQAPKFRFQKFSKLVWNDVQREIDIQARATLLALQTFLPKMAARRSGKVLFILSSVTIRVPPSALSHYVMAKYMVLGLMNSLLQEYSAKNIQINAISPSMVETKFLSELDARLVELTGESNPLGRNAFPSDVAGAATFLLGSNSQYISGVNLPVTGGGQ